MRMKHLHLILQLTVPMDPSNMTQQKRQEDINLLVFFTEKFKIRSHACADESVQRRHPRYKKEDVALSVQLGHMRGG